MLTVVGLIKSEDIITGFRVINNITQEIMDIDKKEAYNNILKFTNLKICNDKLKGKSGVLSKYGVVGGESLTYTLLAELEMNGHRVGFEVSDNNGNIKRFNTETVFRIHRDGKLTNGRLNVNGVSLIKGTLYKKRIRKKAEYIIK